MVYWQRAGQQASDRSAYLEAISHVTTEIELLDPAETPERTQHAVTLYITLGAALEVTKGQAAPGAEHALPRRAMVSADGRGTATSQSCLGCGGFIWYGHSCTRRARLGATMLPPGTTCS